MVILYCLLGLAALSVLSWVLYVPMIVQMFEKPPFLMQEPYLALSGGDDCQFESSGGITLRGSYYRTSAPARLGVVIFCHGFAGSRWQGLYYVRRLRREGFDVLTFDFRNHGESDSTRRYEPLQWITQYELDDLRAAVNYVCGRENLHERGVGIIGVSKGGAAALCAAATDPRIRAVATDGAFATDMMICHFIRRFSNHTRIAPIVHHAPDVCLSSFCKWCKFLVGRRRKCRFLNVESFARRVKQPVFMVQGQRDNHVPLEVAHNLRLQLAGRSKLWLVAEANHNQAIHVEQELYEHRLVRFFTRHLGAGSHRHAA